jgi:hypothetical protein
MFLLTDIPIIWLNAFHHTTHLVQECHNSKFVIFQEKLLKVLKCYNLPRVQWWHNCCEFCKLRYDTIPVKSAPANISFYNNNSKMPNFELWHSCRKWAIRKLTVGNTFSMTVTLEQLYFCGQRRDMSLTKGEGKEHNCCHVELPQSFPKQPHSRVISFCSQVNNVCICSTL